MNARTLRSIGSLLALAAMVSLAAVPGTVRADEFEEFGFQKASADTSTAVTGARPDFTTEFVLNHHEDSNGLQVSNAHPEDISVELPPGLVGNPNVVEACQTGEFLVQADCPVGSQVGVASVLPSEFFETTEPLYNLEPPHRKDEIARLGFFALINPVFIDITVRTGSDYGITATIHQATGQAPLVSARTTIWGVPADESHDTQRLTAIEALVACHDGTACLAPEGKRKSPLEPKPFLTNPSACENQEVKFSATSYQLPGQLINTAASMPPTTDCTSLAFEPTFDLQPTNHRAGAPTGIDTVLRIPQQETVGTRGTSTMRAAKVTLPPGMTISSGAADGLEACSAGQVALGLEVASGCPEAAQVGTATIISPALPEPIQGTIYQRTPEPGHLFRIWLVTNEFGLHLKLPGDVRPDPKTGQLTVEFQETPQLPVEEIDLDFKEGPRAPLKNPEHCGTYETGYQLTPWSGRPGVEGQSSMTIDEGCGVQGFSPKLQAGVTNPVAGAFSPFVMNLRREDGEENVAGISMTMPKGELAKLAGVPLCPGSAAGSGSCPAGSQIGSVSVATGPGSQPLWIPQPGKAPTAVYLAGPYKGAPYSAVIVVPAQAGPFDLGTVVVRAGIYVDPETAQVTIKADPLPQILEGVPVLYRTIHVSIDRDQFTVNPTDCEPMSASAAVVSASGASAAPSDRFQVGECAALAFKPRLKLSLKGSTKHTGHPALRAVLTARPGESNIGRAQVNLPQGEFLDQSNLNRTCTRPVLLAGGCPASSVYGHVKAWTPLLEEPLEGNVYLVGGYGYKLPALVAELNGQIRILLVGKVDSGPNKGIRNTFEVVPDAPVSRFVLQLKGGKRYGLLENSENLCQASKASRRAIIRFTGQNGKVDQTKPVVTNQCGKKKKKH